jgi:hypothetical protein
MNRVTITILVASAITSNLMGMNPTPPKPPVAIKAPTSLEEVDTKGFPYILRYKNQVNQYKRGKGNPISREQALKVLHHPLCVSLEPKFKDETAREEMAEASFNLSFDARKYTFLGNDMSLLGDAEAQIQNDRAMAIYNCAVIFKYFSRRESSEKIINNFLAQERS